MVMRPSPCAGTNSSSERLSYKFQRLREQIRAAISSGEFAAQLPGERELGRRFHANAKTVNKALCDLSSEGLLVRQIGRGTFIAPQNGQARVAGGGLPCILLLPKDSSALTYRSEMTRALMDAMDEKGVAVEAVTVDRLVAGQTPLASWPVSTRRSTQALVCYPLEALSGGLGHPSEELLLESWRRHVATVVVGALGRSARVSAVAPDYGDAGLRMAEHLFQAGCEGINVLISTEEGREAEMVCAGAQAAGMRLGKSVVQVMVGEGWAPSTCLNGSLAGKADRSHKKSGGRPVGIVCVGASVLRAVAGDEVLQSLARQRVVMMVCLSEPGDDTAEALGVTSYEVHPRRIAAWAARLIAESRPGQRPLEVLIPGELKVRGPQRDKQKTGMRRGQVDLAQAMM